MRHRIGERYFRGLTARVTGADRCIWYRCEDYELRGDQVVAKHDFDNFRGWDIYWPLKEVPDLLLRFARLCKERNFEESVLAFARRFGLPDGRRTVDNGFERTVPDVMSLSRIRAESRRAQAILALYEAALNGDPQAAQTVFCENRQDRAFEYYHDLLSYKYPEWGNDSIPRELWFALECVNDLTKQVSDKFCRKVCIPDSTPRGSSAPHRWGLTTWWEFDNLIGAMYLQAHWMVTSGDELTHCENCGMPISFARPHPDGRKRRRDKRFCDDACRQAHHRSKKKA